MNMSLDIPQIPLNLINIFLLYSFFIFCQETEKIPILLHIPIFGKKIF